MNASAVASPAVSPVTPGTAILGVGPLLRIELVEWWRSRRALVVLAVTTPLVVLNVLSARLTVWSAQISHRPPLVQVSMDPTVNVLGKWDQWLFVFAILMSAGLVIGERERGTLAWTLSKPAWRAGLLVAKWTAAMVMGTLFGLVLPMVACVIAAIPAYGMPDLRAVGVATVMQLAVPAFFFALDLWLGVVLPSQVGIAVVALIVAMVPGIIGGLVPSVAAALPPAIGSWAVGLALGAPVSPETPIGWAVGMVVVAWLGVRALRRLEL